MLQPPSHSVCVNSIQAFVQVNQGSLSDAASLMAAVGMAVEATGVTPSAVYADDGYTSLANLEWIRDGLGALASLSGAKGRRLTPPGEWDDDAHRAVRRRPGAHRGSLLHAEAGPPPLQA